MKHEAMKRKNEKEKQVLSSIVHGLGVLTFNQKS
jgi:hypothetical protein